MKSEKLIKKLNKIMPRKKVAPPTKVHKSKKDKLQKDYSHEIDARDLT